MEKDIVFCELYFCIWCILYNVSNLAVSMEPYEIHSFACAGIGGTQHQEKDDRPLK